MKVILRLIVHISFQIIELDLSTVVPSLSGPKRPHDRVPLVDMKKDFQECLTNKVMPINGLLKIMKFFVGWFQRLWCPYR